MREISTLTFVTLDGVMQSPKLPDGDTSGGFEHGGWAAPYWGEVTAHVHRELADVTRELLLGRSTFDLFREHQSNGPENSMTLTRKYVATSAPQTVDWGTCEALTGDITAEVSRIKNEAGPPLQINGSWKLIQTLLAEDLIDTFRIWTFPVVVGTGKRLFGGIGRPTDLELVKCERSGPLGVALAVYRLPRRS